MRKPWERLVARLPERPRGGPAADEKDMGSCCLAPVTLWWCVWKGKGKG